MHWVVQNQIFEILIVDKPEQKKYTHRIPHRDIAGKMRIMGNIFDTASGEDWNLPK